MAMDPQKKDDIFRNPGMTNLHFGRYISTVVHDNKTYSAMQMGKGKETSILICETDQAGGRHFIQSQPGIIHHPCLYSSPEHLYVAWNEFIGGQWKICCAEVDTAKRSIGKSETVFESEKVCRPPSMAVCTGQPWIAFSSIADNKLEIHIASRSNGQWTVQTPFKSMGGDCFRPRIASNNNSLFLAWDHYSEGTYKVSFATREDGRWKLLHTLGQNGQRWLTPRLIVDEKGGVYLCWVVLQAVKDKLGVIDHHPYIRVARYQAGHLHHLADQQNAENIYIAGDLREGLLAGEIYKGHVGLRRNPQLALDEDQNLYLFWEMRKETRGSDVLGHLVGRKLFPDGQWSSLAVYSSSGYCYSVPDTIRNNMLPVSFYYFEAENLDVTRLETMDLRQYQEWKVNPDKWKRWKNITIHPQLKPGNRIELHDGEYDLVWADTHCHSNFSPDAEGEPDELANFARDTAGIDVISIIDNDYYPHKALTEVEWRIHEEMAEHFSATGKFIWLPGYEFTYHRRDLNPDFNHRCVIYPRRGGRLLRRIDPESNTDTKMIAELKKTSGMAYPHHCSYELVDNDLEWNIEACSSWRVCLEETLCTIEKLKAGARIGFIGSSDTHRMVPGLAGARTGLFVKELTPEALFDAYRNRRIIATQGFNIFMDLRVDHAFIGQEIETRKAPVICAHIQSFEDMDYVEVLRDGESIWWDSPSGRECSVEFEDNSLDPGWHFYFLKVKLHGDPSLNVDAIPANNFPKPFEQNSRYPHNLARAQGVFAWTSPVWVNYSQD
jgi:hypothetical protein